MDRSKGRRRPAARIIGWGLVAIVYAAVLVWAGGLTATEATTAQAGGAVAGEAVAGALVAVPGGIDQELAVMSEIPTPAEAPLVTLALAAGMVFVAVGWYAIHTYRQRHPRVRSARLIVRHITTLM
jgi:hypothetical protein